MFFRQKCRATRDKMTSLSTPPPAVTLTDSPLRTHKWVCTLFTSFRDTCSYPTCKENLQFHSSWLFDMSQTYFKITLISQFRCSHDNEIFTTFSANLLYVLAYWFPSISHSTSNKLGTHYSEILHYPPSSYLCVFRIKK